MSTRRQPPPEIYPDEPVLARTGPHWMAEDFTVGLALVLVAFSAVAWFFDRSLLRFAPIPAVPLLIRLAIELPRFWRFTIVVTTRRVILNVGTLRDVYHTLMVRDMVEARLEQGGLGRVLGFGSVAIVMHGQDATGAPKTGSITLDRVRDPEALAAAINSAITRVS